LAFKRNLDQMYLVFGHFCDTLATDANARNSPMPAAHVATRKVEQHLRSGGKSLFFASNWVIVDYASTTISTVAWPGGPKD
jgi:hypothetical protein